MNATSLSAIVTLSILVAAPQEEVATAVPKPAPIEKEVLALFDYDREADLEIEERGLDTFDGYSVTDLTYASPAGGRVPAYLYQPDGDGPHAGIVLMHGMPGSREGSKRFAQQYVRTGAVVLAISAPWARPDGPRDDILTLTKQDRDEQIQLMQDLRRGVDLLQSLPWVDRERIGYIGGSYGGAMGGLLAGIERRIKAFVLVVGDGGLVAHQTGEGDELPPPGPERDRFDAWVKLMTPIEPIRFVAHAAPSELLFQNGRTDQLVPAADATKYQEAGSQPKTILWYDDGHSLSQQRLIDHVEWLAPRIGIDAAKFPRY